ncbi:DUF6457 domain-containing protein [Agromyces sp. NPDC056379]|uniref:DUF6457 domain-containing protein n=1 Tax=unclassified Agromyces TaxID=2639701 RepID=UPI0035E1631E
MNDSTAQATPGELDEWVAALAAELGIDASGVSIGEVLDLTREVAHGVARPAGPLSTLLVGLAAGAGKGSIEELSAKAGALAARWPELGMPDA